MTLHRRRCAWSLAFAGSLACAAFADAAGTSPLSEAGCRALAGVELDRARVADARAMTSGDFDLPDAGRFGPRALENLPAFCRVRARAAPVPGSRIGFELWLPLTRWNGKLEMVGNGGYSSALAYPRLGGLLRLGYAAVATDTGHQGDDPAFAEGRPEAIADWGHRAVHWSIVHAKTLVRRAYGRTVDYTYFAGCSTGGQQALMAAQRYPGDFDGIIAGAPGHNRTHLNASFLWRFLRNHKTDGVILPASALPLIHRAVMATCGADNGAGGGLPTDPFLNDPSACDFDPAVLQCGAGASGDCLSGEQVAVLRALYDGARNPRTGERIYYGQVPGSEVTGGPPHQPGWSLYWADPANPAAPARAGFWRHWVFGDEQWDWWSFDFDGDMAFTDDRLAEVINAMDADLGAFRRRGGRLIHYHGLDDPVVPFTDSLGYYQRVTVRAEGQVDDFYRLFLAPGLGHCGGGSGPDVLGVQQALEEWVEQDRPPGRIVATRFRDGADGRVDYTRPVCPYPSRAMLVDGGDPRRADGFRCVTLSRPLPALPVGDAYQR